MDEISVDIFWSRVYVYSSYKRKPYWQQSSYKHSKESITKCFPQDDSKIYRIPKYTHFTYQTP